MRRIPNRTVAATILSFAMAAAALPLIFAIPGFLAVSRAAVSDRAAEALVSSARQVSIRLGAGVSEQWAELRAVAAWASADGVGGSFPLRIDTIRAVNPRLAWMGVAAPDGRVLVATERLLEGQDVSGRPWFRAGLQGEFAGDLHEAPLLRRILPAAPGAEPLRLIGFAMPLRRADGSLIGVLASHVDWQWIRDRVRNAPLSPGMEAMLVSRDGTVIVGPQGLEGTRLTLRSVLAAGQGVGVVTEEAWPDGRRYLTVGIPAGSAAGLPGFGWLVIMRQPPEAALGDVRFLASAIGLPLLACALIILLIGFAVARWIGRPLEQLADSAAAVVEDRLDKPVPETRSSREAAMLSAALARLDRRSAKPAETPGGAA